jgi:hypothetical protein
MSGLQEVGAGHPEIMLPPDDLLSRKSLLFVHPSEVLSDQELSISDKRSLLASWVSDAFASRIRLLCDNWQAALLFASTTLWTR